MGRNDSKLPPYRKQNDINMQRYVYVMSCLVGQTVTVQMKDQTQLRGIFHSGIFSSPNGSSSNSDISIILKCARELPVNDKLSGKILDTIIVQGKDMIAFSADDCPTDFDEAEVQAKRRTGFKTDVEISGNVQTFEERELQKWEPENSTSCLPLTSLEDRTSPVWDQFEVNAKRFQVKSTYQEEFYTTRLDVTSIPQSVREKADQIAREIEAAQFGTLDPDKLGEGDLEDDEEARFGAVRGTGGYRFTTEQPQCYQTAIGLDIQESLSTAPQSLTNTPYKHPHTGNIADVTDGTATSGTATSGTATSETATKVVDASSTTATNQLPSTDAKLPVSRAGIALVPKVGQVGLAARAVGLHSGAFGTFHGHMRNASLVKNINALNLEPALPKLDDQGRIDLLTKPSVGRGGPNRIPIPTLIDRTVEKENFLASLNQIKEKMNKIKWSERIIKPGGVFTTVTKLSNKKISGISGSSSKNFRFNPNADAFTPSGRESTSVRCSQCAASENTKSMKCKHKSEEWDNDIEECPKNRTGFKALTSTPKFREPIDRFLMSRLLPLLATEVPSQVHSIWNLDIPKEKRRQFTYNQILGNLQPNPSAAAAVSAAVNTAWQETQQSRCSTGDSARSFIGVSEQESGRKQASPGYMRSRRGTSSATATATASATTATTSMTSPGGASLQNIHSTSNPENRSRSGGEHNQQNGIHAINEFVPSITTELPNQSTAQLFQPMIVTSSESQNEWRVVTTSNNHLPHPTAVDSNKGPTIALSGHAAMYPGRPIQLEGQYPPTQNAAYQAHNGNYIVVSRNPMVSQSTARMFTFVNAEDRTFEHTAMQAPPTVQAQHQIVVPIEPNGIPATSMLNGGEVTVMPESATAFPGAQFMPGSNVVFIPPNAFITPAPASTSPTGIETPMKIESQNGKQHARQLVSGHVLSDAGSQSRWIQTGVDVNGTPIMQQEQRVIVPHHLMSSNISGLTVPNVTTGVPQFNHYQLFQPPHQFTAAGPGGNQPQFIGLPPGSYFPTAPYNPYITSTGQFQSQMPPPQNISYQASQIGAPMIIMSDSQQPQHMIDGSISQMNNTMQQGQPKQNQQQIPWNVQGRDTNPNSLPQSPGTMQHQMSIKHGKNK